MVFLSAVAMVPLAWTALMMSVAGHINGRLRARDATWSHRPVLLAAAVACAVTLVNWRVAVRIDHASQVGVGAGPVMAWMVVLGPGAAAWIAGSLARSIQIGLAAGVGVVAAALIWAVAT